MKIKFKLGDQDLNYSFMLVPDEFFGSQIDGILGANFLEENRAVIKFENKEILFKGNQKPISLGITDTGLSSKDREEVFILSAENLYLQLGEICRIQGYCKMKHDSRGDPAQGLVDRNYSTRLPVSVVRELRA